MKKSLLLWGALIALCWSSNASAQTLLYDAAGKGSAFGRIGGTMAYPLTFNGNSIEEGKIVIGSGTTARPAYITVSPNIAATDGITIMMKASNVNTNNGNGQFFVIRNPSNTGSGGFKIKTGTTDGTIYPTWNDAQWASGADASIKFPTDGSSNIITYAFANNNPNSTLYLNGTQAYTSNSMTTSTAIATICFGGIKSDMNTFIHSGMKIERIRIYAGKLTAAQIADAESEMKVTPTFPGPFTLSVVSSNTSFGNATIDKTTNLDFGDNVTATATAQPNFEFVKWVNSQNEGVTLSTNATYTFGATGNIALKAIFRLTSVSAATTASPMADDGKWYFVQSQRWNAADPTPGPWWTFNGDNIVPKSFTGATNQKFTLTSTTTSGRVTIKEYGEKKMNGWNCNNGTPSGNPTFTDQTGTATGWTLTSNVVSGVQGWAFPGENSGLHQGSSGASWVWRMGSGWYDLTDNSTFFFYEATPDFALRAAISSAQDHFISLAKGSTPGYIPEAAYETYLATILAEKSKIGTSITDEQLTETLTTLANAKAIVLASQIKISTSTAATPKWYLIKSMGRITGGSDLGRTAYTLKSDTVMKTTTALNQIPADGSGMGVKAAKANHLFRFEEIEGKYRIINKALPEGELLAPATGGNSSNLINYGTATDPHTTWEMRYLGHDVSKQQYNIVSSNGGVLHDDGANKCVSWTSGITSASAWYFEEFTGLLITAIPTNGVTVDLNGAGTSCSAVSGGNVTATATSTSPGLVFDKWVNSTGAMLSTENPYTFTATTDIAIKAVMKFAPVLTEATPVVDDNKWYFVKSERTNTAGAFWTFNGKDVYPQPLTTADNQKFTLVTSSDGKVNIKEFSGLLMNDVDRDNNSNNTTASFDEAGVTMGFDLISNSVDGAQGWAFEGGKNGGGLHQGGGSWSWRLGNSGWFDMDDFCTFFFYEAAEDIALRMAIAEAQKTFNTAPIGDLSGQFSKANQDNYLSAILAAYNVFGEEDTEVIDAAISALNMATTTFKASVNLPFETSTAAEPKWFLIKSMRTSDGEKTLYVDGFNAQMKTTTQANGIPADGTGIGAKAATLAHLFRFEKIENAFRIINAAYPAGEVLEAAAGGSSSQPIKYGTATTPNTTWNITFLGVKEGDAIRQYRIASPVNNTNFHDSGSNTMVSWAAEIGSGSAFHFEAYNADITPLYQTTYDAALLKIKNATDSLPSGTAYFQATEAAATALSGVKDRVRNAFNEGTPTEDFNNAIGAVDQAIASYWASLMFPFSTAAEPFWCTIQTVGNNIRVWDALMSKEAETGLLKGILPEEAPTTTVNYATIFRFEKDENNKIAIINHDGTSITTAEYATSFKFAATPFFGWDILTVKTNRYSFAFQSAPGKSININNAANASVRYYTEYFAGGVADKGNQFIIRPHELYYEGTGVGLKENKVSTRAIVLNGSILVAGSSDINIFTITGTQVQNKNLIPGVYVAKKDGNTFKVTVK